MPRKRTKSISSKKRRAGKSLNFLEFIDSDADGLTDAAEKKLGTDPLSADTDRDRLSDLAEVKVYHTNPLDPDTDKDGIPDGEEVRLGLDPNSPNPWKDIFWPHAGNNYKPFLLHTKRAVFYSAFFLLLKGLAIGFIALLPLQAFMAPDVLARERDQILALVRQVRQEQIGSELTASEKLASSAQSKAADMVNYQYFSHVSPEKSDLVYWLKKVDYQYRFAGENLAMGFNDAQSVVRAWVKSPLHYQNIIDKDFSEAGLGIDSGEYLGRQTIFIANHFGAPLNITAGNKKPVDTKKLPAAQDKQSRRVLGEKLDSAGEAEEKDTIYQQERSYVLWKYDGEQTTFTARAYLKGGIAEAVIYLDGYQIILQPDETETDLYAGVLKVNKPVDSFFQVVINPTIIIKNKEGFTLTAAIPWYQVKSITPPLLTRYHASKTMLPQAMTSLFFVTRLIFGIALIIFSAVLLLTIFIKIKKQYPHIIIQTLAVIGLLAVLLSI